MSSTCSDANDAVCYLSMLRSVSGYPNCTQNPNCKTSEDAMPCCVTL